MEFLQHHRKKVQEKLLEAVQDYEYRAKRYGIEYSIVFVYTVEPIDFSTISHHIRKTDAQVVCEEHIFAVVLDCADVEKGIKAANNLFTYLQTVYFAHTIFASVETSQKNRTVEKMVVDLVNLVSYAIEHNLNDSVIDSSQIMKSD